MAEPWQPVALETPWGAYSPGAILLHDDAQAFVVEARRSKEDAKSKISLRIQGLDGKRFDKRVSRTEQIGRIAHQLCGGDGEGPVRAVALPALLWRDDKLFSPRNLVGLLVTTVVMTLLFSLSGNGMAYVAVMAGTGAGVWARSQWKWGNEVGFLAPQRLGLTMDNVLAYALTREAGQLWVPPTAGADRRALIEGRVRAIRERYLELREDIVHRIECSAMYDSAVPATAEFEAALVAWDDAGDADTDRLDALASEVEVTFNVALANAERLGLEHLPEDKRDDGRRASKAARLAVGAATEGEREASMAQVRRILDSLALYYLPSSRSTPELEDGR